MSDSTRQDSTKAKPDAAALGLTALQRRRVLLRGVGKGGAVLAAAVPLSSFANTLKTGAGVDGKAHLCTLSGTNSILPSSAVTSGTCGGRNAGYWINADHAWKAFSVNGVAVSRSTLWSDVFGEVGTTNADKTFLELLDINGPKKTWVRALLNSADGYPNTFPYSPSEVFGLYQDPIQRPNAKIFFQKWV